ncbi:hypothetical protein [Streptomyces sp. NPDC093589]|uniref:hypothetical protein n=1 Tax=Streptomyces sp. NPDC093589 TaxID=3366043 RepID=UPI0037F5CD7A
MTMEPALDELGTDDLHASMTEAMRELAEAHPLRRLWERLDEILTVGGPECLPAPWDAYSEPEHWACDTNARHLTAEVSRLRSAVTDGVAAAIRSVHQRGCEVALPMADRHRCSPRVTDTDGSLDEILDCTCVELCNEDPKSACGLSGRRHVHPASQGSGFGPCPVHPEAPGDV